MRNRSPHVRCIFTAPEAGFPMVCRTEVRAIAGRGLEGDRYCEGAGSFNKNKPGNRQVTFMNYEFVATGGFTAPETRRNIFVEDVELMYCIGKEFRIEEVVFRGIKYCDPCDRPSNLVKEKRSFRDIFFDRGGLIAEVLVGGIIRRESIVTPPPRNY